MKALPSLLLLQLSGCSPDPDPEPDRELLIIDEIEVRDADDTFGSRAIEIEVHLYEVDGLENDRYLGCAGGDSGLEDVDLNDVTFSLRAHFVPRQGNDPIELGDLRQTRLRFVVIEDDESPCPVEQNATAPGTGSLDDLLGKSSTIAKADLAAGVDLSFDQVVSLSVSASGG